MTNAQHTPGPWQVEVWTYNGQLADRIQICNKTDAVAQIHSLYPPRPDETNANAALISAAPELLAALIPLQAWAENERRMHNARDEENEAAYMGSLADAARLAIDKAMGK